jgi:hypothetical protein
MTRRSHERFKLPFVDPARRKGIGTSSRNYAELFIVSRRKFDEIEVPPEREGAPAVNRRMQEKTAGFAPLSFNRAVRASFMGSPALQLLDRPPRRKGTGTSSRKYAERVIMSRRKFDELEMFCEEGFCPGC